MQGGWLRHLFARCGCVHVRLRSPWIFLCSHALDCLTLLYMILTIGYVVGGAPGSGWGAWPWHRGGGAAAWGWGQGGGLVGSSVLTGFGRHIVTSAGYYSLG